MRSSRAPTAAPIEGFDATTTRSSTPARSRDFDAEERFGFKEARRIDRAAQLGVAAAERRRRARPSATAGPPAPGVDPARVGVVAGTGIGGLHTLEEQIGVLRRARARPG